MSLRKRGQQAAATAAGVALATSGLSSCHDNGAVDPLPPPLQCNSVSGGQTLTATAQKTADTARVTVRNTQFDVTWQVLRVGDVTGGTLVDVVLPAAGTRDPLALTIKLASDTTSQASFTVEARLHDTVSPTVCDVRRTFMLTLAAGGIEVAVVNLDRLPLPARQRAEIVLLARDGGTVDLEARTPYQGPRTVAWTVSGGALDGADRERARWTLPMEPGIYQAELVIDYGADGLAVDVMLLEVSSVPPGSLP